MKALKYIAVFIIFTIIFEAYNRFKNSEALETKSNIIEAINFGFKKKIPISLENIGGVSWDKVCFISYELNGIDVSDGLDIPVKYLKIPKHAFSQIANESYNEFVGNRAGLVFWSIKREMFVAIQLKDTGSIPAFDCHDAKDLTLLNQPTKDGHTLTLTRKQ